MQVVWKEPLYACLNICWKQLKFSAQCDFKFGFWPQSKLFHNKLIQNQKTVLIKLYFKLLWISHQNFNLKMQQTEKSDNFDQTLL